MVAVGGKIGQVTRTSVLGNDGFRIWVGKYYMWISAELAKDLGFIKDALIIPANYENLFEGKKLEILV